MTRAMKKSGMPSTMFLDDEIWETRMALKKKLVNYIREKFTEPWLRNQRSCSCGFTLAAHQPQCIDDWFRRRFAPISVYYSLFTDIDRLAKIVNDPEHPVLFFSGKAHPADGAGQGLIKKIYEISQRPNSLVRLSSLRTMTCSQVVGFVLIFG